MLLNGDIKPHNILIGQGDLVKLTDFGSSALPEEIYVRTRENGGTVLYAAPEYADCISRKGNFEKLLKGDIYSLGVLLYQLMTARLTHNTQNQARTYAPFPKPREVNSGICPALEDVILNALAKKPENRFKSIDNFKVAFNTAKVSQLEYAPERVIQCQYQTETDRTAEIVKHLAEGAYEKAVKTARQNYQNIPEVTELVQLIDVLYQVERFYDLQQELFNNLDMLNGFWTHLQYGRHFCGIEHSSVGEKNIINSTLLKKTKNEIARIDQQNRVMVFCIFCVAAEITTGTTSKIAKGFCKPPVKYNKHISCKISYPKSSMTWKPSQRILPG